jgi:DNA-binding GntR family transcriptional regulator
MATSKPQVATISATRAESPPTKHRAVAAALIEQIRNGRLRPGDRLPSEPELSRRFGVSRHTVRAALRTLYESGLATSQQGVGTTVRNAPVEPCFSYRMKSVDDLLQYAAVTPRAIYDATRVAADDAMAAWLDGAVGAFWWVVHTRRIGSAEGRAIASSRIVLRDEFGPAIALARNSDLPVFALLERHFGVRLSEVRQVLSVAAASDEEARDLHIEPGAPVMAIERRFLDQDARLVELSRSVHPAADFRYEMKVDLAER